MYQAFVLKTFDIKALINLFQYILPLSPDDTYHNGSLLGW